MASAANDLTSLNGLFKDVYADSMKQLVPDGVKLLKKIKFAPAGQQHGNQYVVAINLGLEHGVTYGGSGGAAFNLNGAVAADMQPAQVKGTEMVLESIISTAAASRSAGGGKKAFEDGTKHLVQNMLRSMYKRLEVGMFYGQSGIGKVDTASSANNTIDIQDAEWAPGIWMGAENMLVDVYNGTSKRGTATITAVDLTNKRLTVDALPAGVSNGDDLYYFGAYGKEFAGAHKIITNAGTLFNISAADYALWKGNTYTIAPSGSLSFSALEEAIALAVQKGLEGNVTAFVSTVAWNDLLNELTAKRSFDQSYSAAQADHGHESIKFYSQNGTVEIEPSIHVKEGQAFVLSLDEFSRIGSSDVTFNRPGYEGQFFRDLETTSGFGLRLYTDQALFCEAPGRNSLITGIS